MDVNDAGTQSTDTSSNQSANTDASDNQSSQTQSDTAAASSGASDAAKNDQGTQKTPPAQGDQASKEDDNAEPPVRKSKWEYIQERLARKAQKSQGDQQPSGQKPNQKNNQDSNASGEEDYTHEEIAKFKKMAETIFGDKFKAVDELSEKTERADVEDQVTEFLKKDPDSDLLKEFEPKIRRYAQHPSRSQVPIDELVWGIAGKKLISLAAEAVRKAQKASKESQAGGGSNRKTAQSTSKDYSTMSSEDFQKELASVLHPNG